MPCKACHQTVFSQQPKILFFDTENSSNEGRFYGKKYDARIGKITKYWEFLMYSYAWDNGPVQVVQSWNEEKLVRGMWKLIDQADIIVAHNLNFDMGHFYKKCMQYGLPPPREPKRVCTLKLYRKLCTGGFESNKLTDIGFALGFGRKEELPHHFWDDYVDLRTPQLVKKGMKYAKRDIVLLRNIASAIFPFFPPFRVKQLKSP